MLCISGLFYVQLRFVNWSDYQYHYRRQGLVDRCVIPLCPSTVDTGVPVTLR